MGHIHIEVHALASRSDLCASHTRDLLMTQTTARSIAQIAMQHLSAADILALNRVMVLNLAPIDDDKRARLKQDLKDIGACAKRKGVVIDPFEVRRESLRGLQHFELGCWLHFYAPRVGQIGGLWARIDCLRRLLVSDYGAFSPGYDFCTVFDFGARLFDTIFEMGDSDLVLKAVIPLRKVESVQQKFLAAGWTDAYLRERGLLQ